MNRKMNFLISALFTLIISSVAMAQAPVTGVYTPNAPRATSPGLNGTYQPGVVTTQPPTPGTGAYTTGRGVITRPTLPMGNGTYQVNTQGAGAAGGTAPGSAAYNTKALGVQAGGSQILTGPQVGAGTAPATGANNSYGSYSRNRNLTGFGGVPSSQTTTAGSGDYPTYGRTQSGSVYGRTRSNSTYNNRTQSSSSSSSTYGASRRRP